MATSSGDALVVEVSNEAIIDDETKTINVDITEQGTIEGFVPPYNQYATIKLRLNLTYIKRIAEFTEIDTGVLSVFTGLIIAVVLSAIVIAHRRVSTLKDILKD